MIILRATHLNALRTHHVLLLAEQVMVAAGVHHVVTALGLPRLLPDVLILVNHLCTLVLAKHRHVLDGQLVLIHHGQHGLGRGRAPATVGNGVHMALSTVALGHGSSRARVVLKA